MLFKKRKNVQGSEKSSLKIKNMTAEIKNSVEELKENVKEMFQKLEPKKPKAIEYKRKR